MTAAEAAALKSDIAALIDAVTDLPPSVTPVVQPAQPAVTPRVHVNGRPPKGPPLKIK